MQTLKPAEVSMLPDLDTLMRCGLLSVIVEAWQEL